MTGEIDFRYGEAYWEEEFEALQLLHRLIDSDLPIPNDFFDYWQAHFPSHKGQRSEIVETEEFGSVGEATKKLLTKVTLNRKIRGNLGRDHHLYPSS